MAWLIFGILSFLCVASAAAMIISRNSAHNALFLVLCFACLGGLFGLLEAPFAAVVQVIIYAGAIMVLFLFAVMMTDPARSRAPEKKKFAIPAAAVIGLILLAELGLVAWKAFRRGPGAGAQPAAPDPAGLGRLLFTRYLYPFEITSVLLLAALAGAMSLAGKRPKP